MKYSTFVPVLMMAGLLSACGDKTDSAASTPTPSAPVADSATPAAPAPRPSPVAAPSQRREAVAAAERVPERVEYPAAPPVVTVKLDPPLSQPAPLLVRWAPPPMLNELPPPPPFPDAQWVGGYWVWRGDWVWASGYWARPPRPNYTFVHPYYEHRDNGVVFIDGHWAPPGERFVVPAIGVALLAAVIGANVHPGPPPMGPPGVFVPPPFGSRYGLIVPAPIGTSPSVVVGAPPVVNVGMRIEKNSDNETVNRTTIDNRRITNNTTNITRVTNNITHVSIVAPPSATANGQGFQRSVATAPGAATGAPADAATAVHAPQVVHPPERDAPTGMQAQRPVPPHGAPASPMQAPAPMNAQIHLQPSPASRLNTPIAVQPSLHRSDTRSPEPPSVESRPRVPEHGQPPAPAPARPQSQHPAQPLAERTPSQPDTAAAHAARPEAAPQHAVPQSAHAATPPMNEHGAASIHPAAAHANPTPAARKPEDENARRKQEAAGHHVNEDRR
ncbi:MAG: hypothetical protein ACRYG8_21090 [Janthinobacterium lividum]